MPHVDASRRVVEATAAQQVARPKMSVIRVDNGDGTYSYYQQVYLANPSAITGPVDVTIDGEAPQADSLPDGSTVLALKLRLGIAGADDGYVARQNPLPMSDNVTQKLLVRVVELLEVLVERG